MIRHLRCIEIFALHWVTVTSLLHSQLMWAWLWIGRIETWNMQLVVNWPSNTVIQLLRFSVSSNREIKYSKLRNSILDWLDFKAKIINSDLYSWPGQRNKKQQLIFNFVLIQRHLCYILVLEIAISATSVPSELLLDSLPPSSSVVNHKREQRRKWIVCFPIHNVMQMQWH